MIKENIDLTRAKINEAVNKSGRALEDVTLINVSKTKPKEMIMEAYEYGERHFGENKVQELVDKMDTLPQDISWHMIGHLQRNKVKYIVGRVALIHSVDSYRLAEAINIESIKKNVISDILIEVNIAEEISKFGVRPEEVVQLVEEIAELPNVRIKGLMTVAPYVVDSEENRQFFHKIRDLSVDIMTKNIHNVSMDVLSMGMSGDYEIAIEEGATMVRVGTGIFGERNYG